GVQTCALPISVPSQRSFCHITPPRWRRGRADASMQEQKKLRVLIADDEPLARQRIVDMLSRESGVEVVGEIADGVEAVEAIRSRSEERRVGKEGRARWWTDQDKK